jgi:hypothetical protein
VQLQCRGSGGDGDAESRAVGQATLVQGVGGLVILGLGQVDLVLKLSCQGVGASVELSRSSLRVAGREDVSKVLEFEDLIVVY